MNAKPADETPQPGQKMQKIENTEKAVTTTGPSGQTPENTEKTAPKTSPPGKKQRVRKNKNR
jgi:hypothetical protein